MRNVPSWFLISTKKQEVKLICTNLQLSFSHQLEGGGAKLKLAPSDLINIQYASLFVPLSQF